MNLLNAHCGDYIELHVRNRNDGFILFFLCSEFIILPDDKTGNNCPQKGISQDGSHVTEKVSLKDKTITHINDLTEG